MPPGDRPARAPASNDDRLTLALRTGHFKDALRLLRRQPDRRPDLTRDALLAELQMRVGEVDQAALRAQRLLARSDADYTSQSRCHLVIGTISRDTGRLDLAKKHYDRAVSLANLDHNLEQLCLAQMRWLTLHVWGADRASDSVFPALERNVRKSGDPMLAAALHTCAAEIDTRSGRVDRARSALVSARRLLRDAPNVFLEGNAAIAGLCLSLLCSDWNSAIEEGLRALNSAGESGNLRTELAARLNLGQVFLSQGRIEEAERHLNEALRLCPRGGNAEIGLLDALAQASLARGDTAQCEDWLHRIDVILATHDLPVAYNRYWGLRTKLSLLERLGRWHEAADLVTQVGTSIPDPADTSLHTHLTLAKADIYLATGRIEEAHRILLDAMTRLELMTSEHQGQLERLLALHAARTTPRDAPHHFERASRIFVTTGSHASYFKILDEYSSFLSGWSPNRALDEREPDAMPDSRQLLARLAALQRFRGDVRLLGIEAFWLFVECGDDLNVALVREDGLQQRLIVSLPADSRWFEDPNQESQLLSVQLGRGDWMLFLRPKRDRSPSLICRTLAALVQSLATNGTMPERGESPDRLPPSRDTGPSAPVFASESMDAIVRSVSRVASTTLPVLITGETGTGKEVLARSIHQQSGAARGPFVAFNCATVPHELLDSQLFGHRRGAFTGAHQDFSGIIRAAEGGTLFLDEIGDLSRDAQPKLLRFLESGELHPLGAARPVKAAVRVIAATNAPLDALVLDGRFRQDLLYRLDGVRYHLPPLRERREDIPPLVAHFLAQYAEEFHKGRVRIANETLEYLLLYAWPGNVRQLANEIRRAVALADADATLEPDCLSAELVPRHEPGRPAPAYATRAGLFVRLDQPLGAATAQLERAMLEHALRASGGRVEEAATRLGLSRKGLYLKRHRLDLDAAPLRRSEPEA